MSMDERLLQADTIIFDVGNVLLRFDPERVVLLLPEEHRAALKAALFGPALRWSEFDLGRKTNGEIAEEAALAAGVPGGGALVLELLRRFHETMEPLPLYLTIPDLKQRGKRVYLLTNYAEPSFSLTREAFPELKKADGEVVSSREKTVKPGEEIYRILIRRYAVDPARSLYIDDREDNARAGERAGFRVWHYAGADVLP